MKMGIKFVEKLRYIVVNPKKNDFMACFGANLLHVLYFYSMKKIILVLFVTLFGLSSQAQEKAKWDVTNPGDSWAFDSFTLNTTEGTWMNLDISPDGKSIVFDLLGDVYTMPIKGGKATPLRTGLAFEIQPRFSPNGKQISFTSDAGGGDNIWTMDLDGQNATQITKEKFRLLNNAVWSADGNYLIARKHFTSGRSLGAGEMWMYHKTGGTGVQLTKRKNDQQDVNEPCASKDGKYLYYSEDVYPGGYFQYNKDPNKQIYAIFRYNFEEGTREFVTGGPGGAARPQISDNGKYLAFVKRVREKTVLYIRNMETAEEWPVYDQLNKDQQEAWAIFGVYTNFAWTPDNECVVIWAGGKFKKIKIFDQKISEIPFEVSNTIKLVKTLEVDNPAHPEKYTAKAVRQLASSPNGTVIVFNAIGHLWIKSLPDGAPVRLTTDSDFEFEPSFSADGKNLVYVSWNDEKFGSIKTYNFASGKSKTLSQSKGIFRSPRYSSDGLKITYLKEGGNMDQGHNYSVETGIYIMDADGSGPTRLIRHGGYPMFNASNDRIFYQTGGVYFGNNTKRLWSVDLNGQDKKKHFESKYAHRIIPSPDNNWVLFTNLHKVYLAPFPPSGKSMDLSPKGRAFPVAPVSKEAGWNIHWASNSNKIHWTYGDQYFTNQVADRFTFLKNSADTVRPLSETGISINLVFESDKPQGLIAFTHARIITMENDQIIEDGTIVVNENRITALGKSSDITVPKGAKVIDATGKTIMPGIIDVHAHVGGFRHGLTTQKHWQLYANLAYGVTTSHDPSANSETIFSLSELVRSGKMVGPRLYSTGFILYGADNGIKAVVNSLDDARFAVRRTKAYGALSVKSYNQPRRDQRQQVLQAAKEEGIFVVPEGGSTFYHNMTMIMDGHTGVEHNIPVAPVYKDITELWSKSNTGYTPTLIVNYGGVNGEFYWYQHTKVWENEKLLKYYPRSIIDARSRHRTMIPQKEYENGHILSSKTCTQLAKAGVKINLGAHGQLQGLGAHWELWNIAQGGMENLEVLKSATINGAEYIGLQKDIGSLKVGKLADLIVLDKNPLDNIQNSNSVKYTMVNGRLFDTETMDEIANSPKKRSAFYWESAAYNRAFPWHKASNSFMHNECSCRH
jgi:imidazolonepropionase-like amidohydrolase/Tol biopolymer transport system component